MAASGKNREISPPVGPHIPENSKTGIIGRQQQERRTRPTGILHIPSLRSINHAKDGWNNRGYNFQVGPALPPQLVSLRL
jgi:hypothetical protein